MYLTRLQYFVAAAEEGSVIGAARRLRVAQPALSRQLHVLEREVGTRLLERTTRGIRLLPAGVNFLQHARRVLAELGVGIASARRVAEDATGAHVRMAPPDSLARCLWVADAVARARGACPGLVVELCATPWLLHAEAVRNGAIDVGFGIGLSVADFGDGIVADRVCDEPGSSAVLPLWHPLARRPSLTLAELRDVPTLIPPRATVPLLHDQMLAMVRRGGYEPVVRAAGASFAETMQLVVAGAGWVLAVHSVGEPPAHGTVVVPISDAPVMLGFFVLRRSAEAGDGAAVVANAFCAIGALMRSSAPLDAG